MDMQYEPVKAFKTLDENEDGLIDAEDFVKFMKKQFIKLSEEDGELIVKEFDADLDGTMSFDEFCQFSLPSTNHNLRQLCQMRRNSYLYDETKPLTIELQGMLTRLIEEELRLIKRRDAIKRELLKREDFVKTKAFYELSSN